MGRQHILLAMSRNAHPGSRACEEGREPCLCLERRLEEEQPERVLVVWPETHFC